jgi:hypothetical protein
VRETYQHFAQELVKVAMPLAAPKVMKPSTVQTGAGVAAPQTKTPKAPPATRTLLPKPPKPPGMKKSPVLVGAGGNMGTKVSPRPITVPKAAPRAGSPTL